MNFLKKSLISKSFEGSQQRQGKAAGYETSMSLMLFYTSIEYNNVYYPDTFGTKGVGKYYERLLFHITSFPNVVLYVGNSDTSLANLSLKILLSISKSFVFRTGQKKDLLQHKMLSIFRNIDESETFSASRSVHALFETVIKHLETYFSR